MFFALWAGALASEDSYLGEFQSSCNSNGA